MIDRNRGLLNRRNVGYYTENFTDKQSICVSRTNWTKRSTGISDKPKLLDREKRKENGRVKTEGVIYEVVCPCQAHIEWGTGFGC